MKLLAVGVSPEEGARVPHPVTLFNTYLKNRLRTKSHQINPFLNAQWDDVQRVLRENPEYASQQDSNGCLPLHLACKTGAQLEDVKNLLMIYPWATHVQDKYGLLPIHYLTEDESEIKSWVLMASEYCQFNPKFNPNTKTEKSAKQILENRSESYRKESLSGIICMVTLCVGIASFLFTLISNFSCQSAVRTLTLTNKKSGINSTYNFYYGIWH